jgi:hypothetical protein
MGKLVECTPGLRPVAFSPQWASVSGSQARAEEATEIKHCGSERYPIDDRRVHCREHTVDVFKRIGQRDNGRSDDPSEQLGRPRRPQWPEVPVPSLVGTPGRRRDAMAEAGRLVRSMPMPSMFGWNDRFAEGSLSLGMADGQLYSCEIETRSSLQQNAFRTKRGGSHRRRIDELMALSEEIAAAGINPVCECQCRVGARRRMVCRRVPQSQCGRPQKVYDALTGRYRGPIRNSWPRSRP